MQHFERVSSIADRVEIALYGVDSYSARAKIIVQALSLNHALPLGLLITAARDELEAH